MPASSTMGRTTTATPEVEPTTLQIDPSHSTTEFAVRHLMVTTVNTIDRAFVVCLTIRSRGRLTR